MDEETLKKREKRREQSIESDVARCGWSILTVADHVPPFSYSVGFMRTLTHPEVIIFGMQPQNMSGLLHAIGLLIREGRRFEEPGLYEDLLEGVACKFIPVLPKRHPEFLGYAMWHRRITAKAGTLRAVQCVWPDKLGRFPGEPGCHPNAAQRQILLDRIG